MKIISIQQVISGDRFFLLFDKYCFMFKFGIIKACGVVWK
jgi:hypothetical protein